MWALARARVAQWDRVARDPQRIQLKTLLSHCRTAASTEFGRAHALGSVRSYADLEPALVGSVERLIDFVTEPASPDPR